MDTNPDTTEPASENLAELYDLPTMEWSRVTSALDAGFTQAPGTGGPNRFTCWIATINPDGSAHTTGIGAMWHDGSLWFETGATSRKGRNLARDPRCSLSVALTDLDLTVEGTATLVDDPEKVATLAEKWAAEGWPCEPDESGTALTAPFSAPSAGPPPWHVYRIDASSAVALLCVEPSAATRWRF